MCATPLGGASRRRRRRRRTPEAAVLWERPESAHAVPSGPAPAPGLPPACVLPALLTIAQPCLSQLSLFCFPPPHTLLTCSHLPLLSPAPPSDRRHVPKAVCCACTRPALSSPLSTRRMSHRRLRSPTCNIDPSSPAQCVCGPGRKEGLRVAEEGIYERDSSSSSTLRRRRSLLRLPPSFTASPPIRCQRRCARICASALPPGCRWRA